MSSTTTTAVNSTATAAAAAEETATIVLRPRAIASTSTAAAAEFDAETLAVIEEYRKKHGDEKSPSDEERKEFDDDVLSSRSIEELLPIITAAHNLGIKGLVEIVARRIAQIMKNKSVKWVREKFGIENDFTPEEEEEIRKEHAWAFEGTEDDD